MHCKLPCNSHHPPHTLSLAARAFKKRTQYTLCSTCIHEATYIHTFTRTHMVAPYTCSHPCVLQEAIGLCAEVHPFLTCRVGQNRIYTPYMTVYLVISLLKIPYMHRIYMVLANPTHLRCVCLPVLLHKTPTLEPGCPRKQLTPLPAKQSHLTLRIKHISAPTPPFCDLRHALDS